MSMTLAYDDNKVLTPTNFLTSPNQHNIEFTSIFKENDTHRIKEIINEIDSLDSAKKQHKQSKNFLEADQAANKLRVLKVELVVEKRSQIKARQAQEIQEIEDAYQKELLLFEEYWNTKFAEFDHEATKCESISLKNNEEAIHNYEQELYQIVPIRPKTSTQHLTFKKMVDQLAKNDDFKEAHKVKIMCENMQKDEIEKARIEKQQRIKGMILAFTQQKQKEFAVLKKKIDQARNELVKKRQQEAEHLAQKFLNLKKEKILLHQLELSKFDLAHRYFVPTPSLSSQYRSKLDLNKNFFEEKLSNLLNDSSEKKLLNRSMNERLSYKKSNASPKVRPISPLNSSLGPHSNLIRPSSQGRNGYGGIGGGGAVLMAHRNTYSAGGPRKIPNINESTKKKPTTIFAIDCLTAALMDNIWNFCQKDMIKLMNTREDMHNKEIANFQKKITLDEKRIQDIDKLLKDEEEKKKLEEAKQAAIINDGKKSTKDMGKDSKKDNKEAPKEQKVVKKGGKDIIPSNPLEQEKLDLQKDIEKYKAAIAKYTQKLEKLKEQQNKYNKLDANSVILELVDKTGERKYVKPKLMTIANTFLSDKGSYYLTKITAPTHPDQEETLELMNIDGFAIRTIEEDEKYVDVPDTIIKGKDTKKGKKAK